MNHVIETQAVKALLLGIISCKCPVTLETEKKLFDELSKTAHQEKVSFSPYLAIADTNPQRTPIHHLFDFCACSHDDPLRFEITVNDVLRYLGSSVHYKMVTSNHPGIASENPELLVSHLLLPASMTSTEDLVTATYETADARISFSPILVPGSISGNHAMYAVHMGVVLSGITSEQAAMLHSQQSLIKEFAPLAKNLSAVDFRSLKPYGDHFSLVCERLRPYSGIV